MKRIAILLALCLIWSIPSRAAAADSFRYENEALGFSLTVSGVGADDTLVEETGNCVNFYHAPSREAYGGLIGSIEVVSPRSDFFTGRYDEMNYSIIAMGTDRVFLWEAPGGGAAAGKDTLEAFRAVTTAFSLEALRAAFVADSPDDLPVIQCTRHLPYLPTDGDKARPDDPLIRGEMALMLYTLLGADNRSDDSWTRFPDVDGSEYARAVDYLASYGILTGYADGTFRPEAPISRAAFAVLLHRCQFLAPAGRYGKTSAAFADVPDNFWAARYINSAAVVGWMCGRSDGYFYPDCAISRAEAVTAINRMLGRDESVTAVASEENPFSDLSEAHWAYGNMMEATGSLSEAPSAYTPSKEDLPAGTEAWHFLSSTEGWAVAGQQLCQTEDGGQTWTAVGEPFACAVSGLFFFDPQNGVALGSDSDTACILFGTTDGGQTWTDLLSDPDLRAAYLPADQFPTEASLMKSIVSAELRPANSGAVYLTIRYQVYESIYVYDFVASRQAVITGAE